MATTRSTDRSHLSIGEVLSLLQDEFPDVTISKIRFLESQGLLDPERTPSGYRKFYEGDVRRLRWILTQQRDKFLPLKVIKERLEAGIEGEMAAPDRSGNGAAASVPAAGTAPAAEPTADPPAAAPVPAPSPAAAPAPSAAPPVAAAPAPVPEGPTEPAALPIWMADAARAKADRGRSGRSADIGDGSDPLEADVSSVSLTTDEMLAASGLTAAQLASLEDYGLITGQAVGADLFYDGEDLVIAQKSCGFLAHGVEARHLRLFKTTAEREASLLESLVLPLVKQRNPESRRQAQDTLVELAGLGQGLRAALLRAALSEHLR
ncbi:MAG TPA: MerR family transcriptional regulator [Acidimicrobiales bacterium]|nr:MerR family transcriptional regulator [Acidimicrobiales bacterium]